MLHILHKKRKMCNAAVKKTPLSLLLLIFIIHLCQQFTIFKILQLCQKLKQE